MGKFACLTASQRSQGCTTQPSSEAFLLHNSVQAPPLFLFRGLGATPLLPAPARVPLQQEVSGPRSPQPSMSGHCGHRLSLHVITIIKHILLTIHVDKLCRARDVSAPMPWPCQDGTPADSSPVGQRVLRALFGARATLSCP